jgi:hypothetical protein
MLQDGVDLRNDWILPSLDLIKNGSRVSIPGSYLECHSCQKQFPSFDGWDVEKIPAGEIMSFDPDGNPYCQACRPDLFSVVPVEPVAAQDIAQWNAPTSKGTSFPKWLTPGTWDWDKQVAKNGIDEMMTRRQAYLNEMQYTKASY